MARKHVPSSIDRLPVELRELIGRLRDQGATIDQIKAKLDELDAEVSRSALGRHIKGLAEVGAELRRTREIATALAGQFGEESDNKLARMNIEMMHSIILKLAMAAATGGGDEGAEGAAAVVLDAEQVMFMSRSLQALVSADKANADRTLKLQAEFAKKAAAEVAKVGKAKGLSADTIQAINHAVLGVAA